MPNWTVAGVQMGCRLGDVAANRAAVVARLREAAARGARLVVFPECVLSGYGFASRADALRAAEPIPGPGTEFIADACRELGVWAVFGMLEAAPGGKLYNACALVGPRGLEASYRNSTCRAWVPTGSPTRATGRSRSTTSAGSRWG
jgi:predicted amidohydrolase